MTHLDHRPSFLLHPSRLFPLPLFLLYPAVQKRPLGGVRQKVHSEGDGEELPLYSPLGIVVDNVFARYMDIDRHNGDGQFD